MKALALDARVILMDEPTGWLAASEVAKLHATIRALKARGVGIVYISHMLDEIFAVCDTMTIMRDGKVIAESAVADIDRPRVVHLMVGEKLARESRTGRASTSASRAAPARCGSSASGLGKRGVFRDVSFDLHAGEILCLTGLIGAKRTELLRTPVRLRPVRQRHARARRQAGRLRSPAGRRSPRGIGFVPEDRHREGLMLDMTLTENLAMATLERFRRGCSAQRRRMAEAARADDRKPLDPAARRQRARCACSRAATSRRCCSASG